VGQQSMLKGAFVAVLAAALLVIGVGIAIYVGIARQRLMPTPTPRPTPLPAATLTQEPSPVPMPSVTPEPITTVRGVVREYTPGALIIVMRPLEGNVEQVIVPENTTVTRIGGERASLREIAPGTHIHAEGVLDALGRLVAEHIIIEAEGAAIPSVTPTHSPTAPPTTPIARRAWHAEYYDNKNLAGVPVLTQEESEIDHDWGHGGPPGLPVDNLSARWRGRWPFAEGRYRFNTYSDDGVRLWVNDELIIDRWVDQAATLNSAELYLPAGDHDIQVEYYEAQDHARIRVWWERSEEFSGWHGEYFSNPNIEGMPAFQRDDPEITFDWGRGAPASNLPVDWFSVRWTRTLELPRGAYRFLVRADDGVRLRIDGRLFIDEWQESSQNTHLAHAWFTGRGHEVVVEYFESAGDASIRVWWEPITEFSGWRGEYYDNAELQGAPVLVRDDEAIDFDWGSGSPQTGFPADNFSVRWRRSVTLAAGRYRFWAAADDGVRVYVNEERIIDQWHDSPADLYEVGKDLADGTHVIVIEYYERGGLASVRAGWDLLEEPTATITPSPSPTPELPTSTPTEAPEIPTLEPTATPTEAVAPTATESPTVEPGIIVITPEP
jgi:hypothetical protein